MTYTLQDLYENADIFKDISESEKEAKKNRELVEDSFYDEIEKYPIGLLVRRR